MIDKIYQVLPVDNNELKTKFMYNYHIAKSLGLSYGIISDLDPFPTYTDITVEPLFIEVALIKAMSSPVAQLYDGLPDVIKNQVLTIFQAIRRPDTIVLSQDTRISELPIIIDESLPAFSYFKGSTSLVSTDVVHVGDHFLMTQFLIDALTNIFDSRELKGKTNQNEFLRELNWFVRNNDVLFLNRNVIEEL